MPTPKGEAEGHERGKRIVWLILALVLGLTMGTAGFLDLSAHGIPLGFAMPLLNAPATVSGILYRMTVAIIGLYVGLVGLRDLFVERRFSVEFLMSVAAFGALYLGFLFEAATVLFLYAVAEYFEGYIEDRARRTVEELSQFMPDKATVMMGASEQSLSVKEVQPGMIMLLRPGERVALDGRIVEGTSSVDQSLVTGESVPIAKKIDDEVYAGTLNLNGVLKVEVSRGAEGTLVSRIVRLVVESRKRKASVEKLVDRFARIYIPIVISLAAFTAFVIPRITGGSFETWLYRSLILLVVSCPSAFLISVPATMFMTIAIAARNGIIVKGGVYIEKMARIKAVVFDKTGTLTFGEPTVHNVNTIEQADERALTYAAALEQYSNHPVARTIVKKAAECNLDYGKLTVKEVKEIPGKGLVGYVNDVHVAVGNMELMSDYACNCDEIGEIYENDKHAFTCVAIEKSAVATICVTDAIREDAVETVKALKKADVHTAMLSGDRSKIVSEIAQQLDVDEARAELFPEDKLRVLGEIMSEYGQVAMVGDGVNDAPALAASDVGIAMGSKGVDAALESADVILVNDKLIQIPYLIGLSDKTVKVAKQNIAASLTVKVILGALGLFGLIPLWFTVASGDDGLTMLVLLNVLRLTRLKP
ncbi:MAG TPA: cation-translocating P-type ATPase [Candidatus Acidoferrum sp.]|nr:cation-translocating P-type ATPase [Candidatus Acidoferrum sp.]